MSSPKKPKPAITKDKIIKLLKDDRDKISYEPASRPKQYKEFKRFVVDGDATDFITCVSCQDDFVIKHNKGSGTGNLINHI